ncbi:MAG: hypothetical protein Q4C11_00115 [Clostridium sp.]|nr:hypothetical protein [Clostridium sp.]
MATKTVKAKDLRNKKDNKIKLEGMEYDLVLDLNAFAELEEIYGNVTEALDGLEKGSFKAIRAILFAILKNQNEELTLVKVGKMINMSNIVEITDKLNKTAQNSLPELDEEEIEEKND